MTLLLTNADLDRLDLPIGEVVEAVEAAYRSLGRGRAVNHPRQRMFHDRDDGSTYWMNALMGVVPEHGYAAMRFDSLASRLVVRDGRERKERTGDFVGLVLLFDVASGELAAVVHDHGLSTRRVAATSAVGVRHLARADARTLAIIGSGRQAHQHALTITAVRPIERVVVHSTDPDRRTTFAARVAAATGLPVTAVATPEGAVTGADVVVAATSSRTPVFDGHALDPGTHVVSIVGGDRRWPAREVDTTTVGRADVVVANSRQQIRLDEQPKLLDPIRDGALAWDDVHELADVVQAPSPMRTRADQITLHDNNVGMGIQFAAVGALAVAAARRAGLGRELDPDLFTTRGGTYAP